MTDAAETPRLNRRQQAKAVTRQKVLDAARALFAAEGGYEAATIRSIAKAAGMSTGAVFASFDDKIALYREIYGHPPITPEVGRRLSDTLARLANAIDETGVRHWDKDDLGPAIERVQQTTLEARDLLASVSA